jgi:hypothetical protein
MAESMSSYPRDLAAAVEARLLVDGAYFNANWQAGLERLLDAAFQSSFQTDELRPTRYTIALVSRTVPDPRPPARPVASDWRVIAFDSPLPASPGFLAKLSQIGSSGAAMLAVDVTIGAPVIWGLIDQSIHYSTYLRHGRESGPRTPGTVQVTVEAPGAISVMRNFGLVAALHGGVLVERRSKPMHSDPLASALAPWITAHLTRIEESLKPDLRAELDKGRWSGWRGSLASEWIQTLARLLLRIVSFRHGGTLVLAQTNPSQDVKVRYPLSYDRLCTAFEKLCRARFEHFVLRERVAKSLVELGAAVTREEYYRERELRIEEDGAQDEVNGCIEFIAALSRVDGAILLSSDLRVVGFGAELLSEAHSRKVEQARTDDATTREAYDTQGLGTRHRSLIRFCCAHPDALGFLVSQDGAVKLMKVLEADLVVWPDVDLILDAQPVPDEPEAFIAR